MTPAVSQELGGAVRRHWLVFLGVAAVAALLVVVGPGKVARGLADANRGWLLLMVPTVLAVYAGHGLAWWIALRGAGIRLPLRKAVKYTYISQAFELLPGGDLWRIPVVVAEHAGIEPGEVAATIVFENLVYFFVLSSAMLPLAIARPVLAAPLAIVMLPQVVIFAILLWPRLYHYLATRVGDVRWLRRFAPQLEQLGPTFRRMVAWRTIVPVVITHGACAILALTLFRLALLAVHATGVSFAQVAFTYAVGQVVGGLTVLPAALGFYEGMMTGLLAVQGVAAATAAAATLVYRAFNDILMAAIGLVMVLANERRRVAALRPRARGRAG